jgi:anti-anti-sigma regulatory factor
MPIRGRGSDSIVSRDGSRTVVLLDGEQDIATVFVLTVTLEKAVAPNGGDLIVDLGGVTFLGRAMLDGFLAEHPPSRTRVEPGPKKRRIDT